MSGGVALKHAEIAKQILAFRMQTRLKQILNRRAQLNFTFM